MATHLVYKNQKSQDFQINIIEMTGDNEINNLIKNELKFYSNKNQISNIIFLSILNIKKLLFLKILLEWQQTIIFQ